jgi:hypothetical protein
LNDHPPIEEIWVNVAEGAEKTGYHPNYLRRLARENRHLPEDQRFIRIRKDSHGYAIWLPDLMHYLTRKMQFVKSDSNYQDVEEIWVNVTEAAELIGYNRQYTLQLAGKLWQIPEESRPVKMRKRSSGYDMWLPDLAAYIEKTGRGPYTKQPENG